MAQPRGVAGRTGLKAGTGRRARSLVTAVARVVLSGAALALVSLGCGGGDSEVDPATRAIDLICGKMYSCYTPAERGSISASHPIIGHSESDCARLHEEAGYGTPEGCDSGDVLHAEELDSCINSLEESTCGDLTDPPRWPVVCWSPCGPP
jgi:hypothetical protein